VVVEVLLLLHIVLVLMEVLVDLVEVVPVEVQDQNQVVVQLNHLNQEILEPMVTVDLVVPLVEAVVVDLEMVEMDQVEVDRVRTDIKYQQLSCRHRFLVL
tara:strand:+ start:176 stop:475 length:300 start_codon:yes stop_codon:yes gene_type:complete